MTLYNHFCAHIAFLKCVWTIMSSTIQTQLSVSWGWKLGVGDMRRINAWPSVSIITGHKVVRSLSSQSLHLGERALTTAVVAILVIFSHHVFGHEPVSKSILFQRFLAINANPCTWSFWRFKTSTFVYLLFFKNHVGSAFVWYVRAVCSSKLVNVLCRITRAFLGYQFTPSSRYTQWSSQA